MKKIVGISSFIVLFSFLAPIKSQQMHQGAKKTISSESAYALKVNMRKLWQEHISWTRNVVLCIVDDLPGKDQAVERLLKNQDDIGEAIKPYYGNDAGKKLAELLRGHITIAAEVIVAARNNNTVAFEEANNRWVKNADEISAFLSKANPVWKSEDLKSMMREHLNILTEQVTARIKKDYKADVQAYDKGHDQILEMADMLSAGIITQFPDKFKTETSSGTSQSNK